MNLPFSSLANKKFKFFKGLLGEDPYIKVDFFQPPIIFKRECPIDWNEDYELIIVKATVYLPYDNDDGEQGEVFAKRHVELMFKRTDDVTKFVDMEERHRWECGDTWSRTDLPQGAMTVFLDTFDTNSSEFRTKCIDEIKRHVAPKVIACLKKYYPHSEGEDNEKV